MANPMFHYDFGPDFDAETMSGALKRLPPAIVSVLPSVVPRVDADGNEVGGVASVLHRVPLGIYVGWNVRADGYDAGHAAGFVGGYVPFGVTRAEREAAGDPRPSLQERYGSHAGYVARVRAAAEASVAEGWLLRPDADRLVAEAQAGDVLR